MAAGSSSKCWNGLRQAAKSRHRWSRCQPHLTQQHTKEGGDAGSRTAEALFSGAQVTFPQPQSYIVPTTILNVVGSRTLRKIVQPNESTLQVFKAMQDGITVVAVKRLRGNLDDRQSQAFLREIATLRDLHSPHIVQFLGACLEPGNTMLVTEWMDESLWAAIAGNNSHGLPLDPLGWFGR